jgi:hypothetical protein
MTGHFTSYETQTDQELAHSLHRGLCPTPVVSSVSLQGSTGVTRVQP